MKNKFKIKQNTKQLTVICMRKLLSICDTFTNEYDIKFIAQKSKLLVVSPSNCHRQATGQTSYCPFLIGGNQIEHVESLSHLGHIITSNLSDKEDIHYRRNCFIGQIKNVLCFYSKQRCSVRTKLFQTYCNSRYGCELWSLYDSSISDFCAAWRKAVRRILNIPPDTHNYLIKLIPLLLNNALPFLDDACKRSARFVFSCIQSDSSLIQSIAKRGIFEGHCKSVIEKNVAFLCSHFGWQLVHFVNTAKSRR